MEETILKTPLYQKHVLHGGRMVPFAGYWLPVQYEGVVAEHMAVRTTWACSMSVTWARCALPGRTR